MGRLSAAVLPAPSTRAHGCKLLRSHGWAWEGNFQGVWPQETAIPGLIKGADGVPDYPVQTATVVTDELSLLLWIVCKAALGHLCSGKRVNASMCLARTIMSRSAKALHSHHARMHPRGAASTDCSCRHHKHLLGLA